MTASSFTGTLIDVAEPVAGAGREDAEATRPNWLILMGDGPILPSSFLWPLGTHIGKAQLIEQLCFSVRTLALVTNPHQSKWAPRVVVWSNLYVQCCIVKGKEAQKAGQGRSHRGCAYLKVHMILSYRCVYGKNFIIITVLWYFLGAPAPYMVYIDLPMRAVHRARTIQCSSRTKRTQYIKW